MKGMKMVSSYESYYGGRADPLFRALGSLKTKFEPETLMYPGSWVHITPSLVFPQCSYLDLTSKLKAGFESEEVALYLQRHKEYSGAAHLAFYAVEYSAFASRTSFDLVISLGAGFVSQACKPWLKKGGLLLASDSNRDGMMASTDPDFELIGAHLDNWSYAKRTLASFFIVGDKNGKAISRAQVEGKRVPKLTKTANYYLFRFKGKGKDEQTAGACLTDAKTAVQARTPAAGCDGRDRHSSTGSSRKRKLRKVAVSSPSNSHQKKKKMILQGRAKPACTDPKARSEFEVHGPARHLRPRGRRLNNCIRH